MNEHQESDDPEIAKFVNMISGCNKTNNLQEIFKRDGCELTLIGNGRNSVVYLMENLNKDPLEEYPLTIKQAVMKISGSSIDETVHDQAVNEIKRAYNNDDKCPSMIEGLMLYLLNEKILKNNISPCIPRFYGVYLSKKLPPTKEFIENEKTFSSIYKIDSKNSSVLYGKDTYDFYKRYMKTKDTITDDTCYVTLAEYADEKDLNDWMNDLGKDDHHDFYILLVLLFQIVFTFAHIQKTIPKFVHRDLHIGNILIKRDINYNEYLSKAYLMSFEDKIFRVPCIPYIAMIWDFEFSDIVGETSNLKSIENAIEEANHFYDMNCLFSCVRYKLDSLFNVKYRPSTLSDQQQLQFNLLNKFLNELNPPSLNCMGHNELCMMEQKMINWSEALKSDDEETVKRAIDMIKEFKVNLVGSRLQTNIEHVTPKMLMTTRNLFTELFIKKPEPLEQEEIENDILTIITAIYGDQQTIVDSPTDPDSMDYLNMNPRNAALEKSSNLINHFFRDFIEETIREKKIIFKRRHISSIEQCLAKELFPCIYQVVLKSFESGDESDESVSKFTNDVFDIFKKHYKVDFIDNNPYFYFNRNGVRSELQGYINPNLYVVYHTSMNKSVTIEKINIFNCYLPPPGELDRLEEVYSLKKKKRLTVEPSSLLSPSCSSSYERKKKPKIDSNVFMSYSSEELIELLRSDEIML